MKAQIVVLAFWAGALLYVWGPNIRERIVAWWKPETLAPYSRYQDIEQ